MKISLIIFVSLLLVLSNISLNASSISGEEEKTSPENPVTEIYALVTFEAGERPDWEKVKSLFIDDAVIVLRTSRTAQTVFSVEGFVNDFIKFINDAKCDETGFTENVLNVKSVEFGDIAHCFVAYEAHIPGRQMTPQQGLDSFQLIKKDGEWKIVSIINEVPKRGESLTEYFLND